MAKETQKQRIEMLQKELDEKQQQIKILTNSCDGHLQRINQLLEAADGEFSVSPDKIQLERKISMLEDELFIKNKGIENLRKRLQGRERDIEGKEKEYKKAVHNERGAGRKEKLDNMQISEIMLMRGQGKSMRFIANVLGCSPALVHKIINKQC